MNNKTAESAVAESVDGKMQQITGFLSKTIATFSNDKRIYIDTTVKSKKSREGRPMTSVDPIDEKIREYGYINFKPLSEEWSIYCLEDETIIKLKVVPSKFLERVGSEEYEIEATVVVTAFSLPDKRVKSLKPEPALTDIRQVKDLEFRPLIEPWNEYKLDNDIKVRIRTIAMSIYSTDSHDVRGEPIYRVYHKNLVTKLPL
jgi:hypothetical protein